MSKQPTKLDYLGAAIMGAILGAMLAYGAMGGVLIMRFEIMRTDNGFMPYDNDCDEYLYNEAGDNCFDKLSDAQQLIDDAVLTVLEHQGD